MKRVIAQGRHLLREWFTIDVRALAALRVSLALLILFDVATRVWLLPDFYTDAGVVPRWLASLGLPAVHVSLHMWSGGIAWPTVLHALLAAAALSLLVGWHTRVATAVTWLLLASLHLRNGYVLDGGDRIMHQLLFWSMFLPLGAVCSLDARGRDPSPSATRGVVRCWAGAGLMLQIAAVYVTAGLLKLHGAAWLDGTAIAYAVGQDFWARAVGVWLQDKSTLTAGLTYAVLAVEVAGPFLLFSPVHTRRCRIAALAIFCGLQLGMALSIDLRLFPFVATAALLPFVPGRAWDAWLTRLRPSTPLRETHRALPGSSASTMRYARDGFVALVLAFVVWENVAMVSRVAIPSPLQSAARAIAMDQSWRMYAPAPGRHNFRMTLVGLRSDSTVVILDDWGESTSWRPVERFREDYRSKSYLEIVANGLGPAELQALGAWVCRTWNGNHDRDERVIALAFSVQEREIRWDGSTAPSEEDLSPEVRCRS